MCLNPLALRGSYGFFRAGTEGYYLSTKTLPSCSLLLLELCIALTSSSALSSLISILFKQGRDYRSCPAVRGAAFLPSSYFLTLLEALRPFFVSHGFQACSPSSWYERSTEFYALNSPLTNSIESLGWWHSFSFRSDCSCNIRRDPGDMIPRLRPEIAWFWCSFLSSDCLRSIESFHEKSDCRVRGRRFELLFILGEKV